MREKYNLDDTSTGLVTKDDIEDVVARWTGVPMTSIKEEEVSKLFVLKKNSINGSSARRKQFQRWLGR